MKVCAICGIEMSCIKTGVKVIFSGGYHIYPGDKFGCNKCGSEIIDTNATPFNPEKPAVAGPHDIVMS